MPDAHDIQALIRDKYNGDSSADLQSDIARLSAAEPLAYVIGWVPFLGNTIFVEHDGARSLIPRPETEWWTELLISALKETYGDSPFTLLDLCAGSGAIGVSVLATLPNAEVSFSEIDPALVPLIQKNIEANGIARERAHIFTGDAYSSLSTAKFNCIATNPPYIPSSRVLDTSVTSYEPHTALFSGDDGLEIIRAITKGAHEHLLPGGMMWLECDSGNGEEARTLTLSGGAVEATLRTDLYGRPRLVVAYW